MVALQKDHALDDKPGYIAFVLIFILFGLAIVAASLNLLVMRFITMNTEDERRDEAEALQVQIHLYPAYYLVYMNWDKKCIPSPKVNLLCLLSNSNGDSTNSPLHFYER